MQVILKKDIPQLGRIGELIKVREGYARNYLIPRSYAVPANSGNVKKLEHEKRLVEIHKKSVQKESQVVADKINGLSIEIERRFNESGKMYGTLTGTDLAAELKKKKFVVDRRDFEFEPIKAPGEYAIKVRLPGDVYANVTLTVTAQKEKAKDEAKKTRAPKAAKAKKAKDSGETEAVAEAPTTEEKTEASTAE